MSDKKPNQPDPAPAEPEKAEVESGGKTVTFDVDYGDDDETVAADREWLEEVYRRD